MFASSEWVELKLGGAIMAVKAAWFLMIFVKALSFLTVVIWLETSLQFLDKC